MNIKYMLACILMSVGPVWLICRAAYVIWKKRGEKSKKRRREDAGNQIKNGTYEKTSGN